MRRVGAGILAVVLALAGCKSTPSKSTEKEPAGTPTAAAKNKTPEWLAGIGKIPGKGTDVPKAGTWAKPGDGNFDVAKESQGIFAGRVFDLNGKGVKRAFIKIEPAAAPPPGSAAPLPPRGIITNEDGFFMTQGLTPGTAYILTAETEQDGKMLSGIVQAKAPAPTLTIQLRDDMLPVPGLPPTGNKPVTTGVLPPAVPGSPGSTTSIPPPDNNGLIPPTPMNVVPNAVPRPSAPTGGAFTPGGVGVSGTALPPTLPNLGPADNSGLPKPVVAPPDKAVNPERIVNGPTTQPMNATIPASIPGGPPPLPMVPSFTPTLPATPGSEKKSALPPRPGANFTLVDTMNRSWDFATSKHGQLVLVEFMTTKCVPCLQSLPGLKDLQAKYGAAGLQLVGVVCDDVPLAERVELAAKYHREKNLNYMLFVEPGAQPGAVRDRYIGDRGYPTVVLLSTAGDVLWTGHPSAGRPQLEAAIQANLGK